MICWFSSDVFGFGFAREFPAQALQRVDIDSSLAAANARRQAVVDERIAEANRLGQARVDASKVRWDVACARFTPVSRVFRRAAMYTGAADMF